jgi:D-methionine transport system permease protein
MSPELFNELVIATWQTIYMVLVSSVLATIIGMPLGIILLVTKKDHILQNAKFYNVLAAIINAVRSLPFIILLIAIIPFTRMMIGTAIGTNAAIVPLTVGAIPFIARIVENAMAEVNPGLLETGMAIGATPLQIILKILIPESLVSIIKGLTVVMISLVGYSAMAGAIGGGGLGDFAIRYGYQQFNATVMVETVVVLIILVQMLQYTGDLFAKRKG